MQGWYRTYDHLQAVEAAIEVAQSVTPRNNEHDTCGCRRAHVAAVCNSACRVPPAVCCAADGIAVESGRAGFGHTPPYCTLTVPQTMTLQRLLHVGGAGAGLGSPLERSCLPVPTPAVCAHWPSCGVFRLGFTTSTPGQFG